MTKIVKTNEQWKALLSAEEYRICREKGTERAFTGEYWACDGKSGEYLCRCCGEALFNSQKKFDSGSGWPSFTAPIGAEIGAEKIIEHQDGTLGMSRTEVVCSCCDAHLGHVFADGPKTEGGLRYCINSASLSFKENG